MNIEFSISPSHDKTKTTGIVPPLSNYDIDYPRVLKAEYSFDGKHFYKSSSSLTILDTFETYKKEVGFKLSSNYFPIGLKAPIFIENLPYLSYNLRGILVDNNNISNSYNCSKRYSNELQDHFFYSDEVMPAGNYSFKLYYESINQLIPLQFPNVYGFSNFIHLFLNFFKIFLQLVIDSFLINF